MTSFIIRRSARVYQHISGIFREIGKEKSFKKCTRKQNAFFVLVLFFVGTFSESRSQWPRGLKRRSAAARLLSLWVLIPPGAWTFVCCECCQVEVSATS